MSVPRRGLRKTAATQLKNLTSTGSIPADEVPIRIDGRTYLVTRPTFTGQPCAVVHLYEQDRLRPVAAIGRGDAFPPLTAPEFMRALGGKVPGELQFVWTDEEDVQRARQRNAELVAFRSTREPRVIDIQPVEAAAQSRPGGSLPVAKQAADPLKPGRDGGPFVTKIVSEALDMR